MRSAVGILLVLFSCLAPAAVWALAPPYYGVDRPSLAYELPPLKFEFGDLEPHIDEQTVKVHYESHHAKYVKQLNFALREWRKANKMSSRISIIEMLRNLTSIQDPDLRTKIQIFAGGFINHNIYWATMTPNKDNEVREPAGHLLEEINEKWGSYRSFKEQFTVIAMQHFGPGWVWLCRKITQDEHLKGELVMLSTDNQDSPIGDGLNPILALDIWEHSYYLKYRNKKSKYVEAWWNLVDWNLVHKLDFWWKGVRLRHDEL